MFATQNKYSVLALSEDFELIRRIEAGISAHLARKIFCTTDILRLLETHASQTSRLIIVDVDLLNEDLPSLITVMRSINRSSRFLLVLQPEDLPWCAQALPTGSDITYAIKPLLPERVCRKVGSILRIEPAHAAHPALTRTFSLHGRN